MAGFLGVAMRWQPTLLRQVADGHEGFFDEDRILDQYFVDEYNMNSRMALSCRKPAWVAGADCTTLAAPLADL